MNAQYLSDVTAVVLTGGLGTRLRQVVGDRPKTMADVAGRPFIEYILDQLVAAGFSKVILCVGYLSDQIQNHLGSKFSELEIEYSIERSLLGTGGAVRFALSLVKTSNVLIMNGDSFCAQALGDFVKNHFSSKNLGSMLITEVADTKRYGRVNFNKDNLIVSFDEKGAVSGPGWINAGVYLFKNELLEVIPPGRNFSLEKDLFPDMCSRSELSAYKASNKTFIDIGTPESFAIAKSLFVDWNNSLRPSLLSTEVVL